MSCAEWSLGHSMAYCGQGEQTTGSPGVVARVDPLHWSEGGWACGGGGAAQPQAQALWMAQAKARASCGGLGLVSSAGGALSHVPWSPGPTRRRQADLMSAILAVLLL